MEKDKTSQQRKIKTAKNKKIALITGGVLLLSAASVFGTVQFMNLQHQHQLALNDAQTKTSQEVARASEIQGQLEEQRASLQNAQNKVQELTDQLNQQSSNQQPLETRGTWIGDINVVPEHLRASVNVDLNTLAHEIQAIIDKGIHADWENANDSYLNEQGNINFASSQGYVSGNINRSITLTHANAPTVQSTFAMSSGVLGARTSTRID